MSMKIVAPLISFVVCLELVVDNLIVPAEATAHFNVTSMKGAEDIYFRLKRRKPSMRPPPEEKLKHKENICMAILGSDLFDEHQIEVVNPNHDTIHDNVKQHQPKMYEQHYKARYSFETGGKPKFVNPYRSYDVSVHGNVIREYAFACLARNCSTKSVERYYVSPEYPANGASKTVRFVFAQNAKKEMVVIAMAEKSSSAHQVAAAGHQTAAAAKEAVEKPAQTTTAAATIEESSYEDESESEAEEDESGSW